VQATASMKPGMTRRAITSSLPIQLPPRQEALVA
jgi:hypothetical protein